MDWAERNNFGHSYSLKVMSITVLTITSNLASFIKQRVSLFFSLLHYIYDNIFLSAESRVVVSFKASTHASWIIYPAESGGYYRRVLPFFVCLFFFPGPKARTLDLNQTWTNMLECILKREIDHGNSKLFIADKQGRKLLRHVHAKKNDAVSCHGWHCNLKGVIFSFLVKRRRK